MKQASSPLWPTLLGAAFLLTLTGVLHAAPTEQQWKTVNHALVTEHIIPRYQHLAESSNVLKNSTSALCQQPDQAHLSAAQQAFHRTMDDWESVQHIQFGPIENLMRNFSMQFWPDKKNLIGKQLNILLAEQDPATLKTDALYKASIGVKGLPALERLLFTGQLSELENNSYRCQLTSTIAAYIAENSAATVTEWQQAYSPSVFNAGSEDSYYDDHQEAAVDMLKSLVEPVEAIRDQKILRPLGNGEKVRPRRSESWRSERSIRNIQLNMASLQDLYEGHPDNVASLLRQQGAADQADKISGLFNDIIAQLKAIQGPLTTTLYQPQTVTQLQQVSASLKQLDLALNAAMKTLDIQLGFNSRDGD
ncbi:imelysin family protein [Amphritea sp. 2_MG-2023]|uniref:imelysin family protein n=1 Tax=Amphritea TaxID=515417 RepID=UPI001C067B4D|nr:MULTISPECIES: imelysin family protein [Amphritea]MBU2966222.1 imelysin family protein [Amphritea atlantica]MDO6417066.1 imelysin family protein [Amphritea sp. 2_MG-2023]